MFGTGVPVLQSVLGTVAFGMSTERINGADSFIQKVAVRIHFESLARCKRARWRLTMDLVRQDRIVVLLVNTRLRVKNMVAGGGVRVSLTNFHLPSL